jgi:hypothetical protein
MPALTRIMRAKMIRPRPNHSTGHDGAQDPGSWTQSTCQVTSRPSRFSRANPSATVATSPPASSHQPTKKATLLALYRAHPDYGNRLTASRIAAELAPKARLQAGTARTYLYAELNGSKS